MGYETRMYIGVPYCGNEKEPYIQIEGQASAFHVFNDGSEHSLH
jgi:DNA relaxase NicK